MTPKELIPQEEYTKMKEKDMEEAVAYSDMIINADDKHMRYRDSRPIMDLKHMFETSVELYGDNPAFWVKDTHDTPYRAISYKEAKADVDALGTALHSRGMRGLRIGVMGDNCYEWAMAYLSVVCGTGVVVPLDKELHDSEIENLLMEAEVDCIFYTKKFSKMMEKIKSGGKVKDILYVNMNGTELKDFEISTKLLLDEGKKELDSGNRDFLDAQVTRHNMGILLFTSGTTGIAKAVMLSHKNICADLMIAPTVLKVNTWDVFFSVLPLHHTYACTDDFLMPIYKGASIAYCKGLKYIVQNLAEAKPTMFLGVPLIFENLYTKIWKNVRKEGKEDLLKRVIKINRVTKKIGLDLGKIFFKQITGLFGGRMRMMISGGAAIDPAILQGIQDFGIMALQGYGLTECAPICALNPDTAPKNDSAGYVMTGLKARIDDPNPETGIGEIVVTGDNVMMGYYNNPEATAEVLQDGWYSTGDYGYLDEDNYVYITGRKKNVIVTKNGKNIFPEELEYLLGRLNIVSESMVWGKPSERNDDTLIVASIKLDDEEVKEILGDNYNDEAVAKLIWAEVDKINDDVAFFKRIKKIVLRDDEFDKTTGKKIKRFVDSNKEGREI